MKTIYIDIDEELSSVIDRIRRNKDKENILVIPRGALLFRNIINLKLLKREADLLNKTILIVTPDPIGQRLAQRADLMVREKIEKEYLHNKEPEEGESRVSIKRPGVIRVSDIIRPVPPHRPKILDRGVSPKPAEPLGRAMPLEVLVPEEEKVAIPSRPSEPEPVKPMPPILEEMFKEKGERVFKKGFFARKPEKPRRAPRKFRRGEHKNLFLPSFSSRLFLGLLGGAFVIFGIVLYLTLSRAEIIIVPKKERVSFGAEMTVDKGISSADLEYNKIPGQLFEVEKEIWREFPSTGEKELEEKARGIITVYNQYSSSPQTLVETTRFVSGEGKLFRTTKTITIPGAVVEEGEIIPSTIDVEVIAAEAGEEYNIGPSTFTIPGFQGSPKYSGFYGKSTESMVGGVKGKVKIVTKDDLEGARDILAVNLKKEARGELINKIPSGLKILEGAQREGILEFSSSIKEGGPGEKFVLTVKVVSRALVFNENDIISLINKNLASKISESKVIIPDTISIVYNISDINLDKGSMDLSCEIEEDIAWKIDGEEIKRDLAGKNEIEVRHYLSARSEVESARVVFWPFWVKKIPSNEKKIKVTIEQ